MQHATINAPRSTELRSTKKQRASKKAATTATTAANAATASAAANAAPASPATAGADIPPHEILPYDEIPAHKEVGPPVMIAPANDHEAPRQQTKLKLLGKEFVVGGITYQCANVVNAVRIHTMAEGVSAEGVSEGSQAKTTNANQAKPNKTNPQGEHIDLSDELIAKLWVLLFNPSHEKDSYVYIKGKRVTSPPRNCNRFRADTPHGGHESPDQPDRYYILVSEQTLTPAEMKRLQNAIKTLIMTGRPGNWDDAAATVLASLPTAVERTAVLRTVAAASGKGKAKRNQPEVR